MKDSFIQYQSKYDVTLLPLNHFIQFQHFTDEPLFSQDRCISKVIISQDLKPAGKLWQDFQPPGIERSADIQKKIQRIPKRPIANIHQLAGD